jgi:hypothetical protein
MQAAVSGAGAAVTRTGAAGCVVQLASISSALYAARLRTIDGIRGLLFGGRRILQGITRKLRLNSPCPDGSAAGQKTSFNRAAPPGREVLTADPAKISLFLSFSAGIARFGRFGASTIFCDRHS